MTRKTLIPGTPCIVMCPSPNGRFDTQFEDDGTTGYFFGLDTRRSAGERVLAALHVYNVSTVAEWQRPWEYRIVWSGDGAKSALVINGRFYAVFDFAARRGYCRTNFPPPDERWTIHDYAWDDRVTAWFESPAPRRRDRP